MRIAPRILLASLFTSLSFHSFAADFKINEGGPIHEAFIGKEAGEAILEAVPKKPPEPIVEKKSENRKPPASTTSGKTPIDERQFQEELVWIPGYFAWVKENQDFVWVCGTWRRPPPHHQWIPGEWLALEGESWVWLPGFWSQEALSQMRPIGETPPDEIDENVCKSFNGDQYWVRGYWKFDTQKKTYVWHAGRFETFDPNWVYSPAHYVWRSNGYLFIPGFWDWPLEKRGVVYPSTTIHLDEYENFLYQPDDLLK